MNRSGCDYLLPVVGAQSQASAELASPSLPFPASGTDSILLSEAYSYDKIMLGVAFA